MIKIARNLKEVYKIPNLCLAGGVDAKLRSKWKDFKEKIFEKYGFSQLQVMQVDLWVLV